MFWYQHTKKNHLQRSSRNSLPLRGEMCNIADSEPWTMPATMGDPEILEGVTLALTNLGYASSPSIRS